MEIEIEKQGKSLLIKVKGRMDAVTSSEFEQKCAELIEDGERYFIVDLERLEYISSAGLRSILITARELEPDQGEICFCNLKGLVREVFSVSGFHLTFSIYDTCEEALERSLD